MPVERSDSTVARIKSREINLISVEERVDTTSAVGELVLRVFGAITQFERRLIVQRTKDELATALATRNNFSLARSR